MHSRERRIRDLEQHHAPVDLADLTDLEREWFRGLCASSWVGTAWQFAELLAERRFWHEAGEAAGTGRRWYGDWCKPTSPAERTARVQAEWDRLARLVAEGGEEGLAAWLVAADREGWPALGGVTFSMDAHGFADMLQRRRTSVDVSRGCDMPGSVAWRRAHPTWRPGMTGEAALAFEVELLDETRRTQHEVHGP